jgi:AcrR family transcriptional regulator
MGRTRAGVLAAAASITAERGTRRTAMAEIAAAAGVAKGTLYNHFRTKDEVFAALIEAEIARLAAECEPLALRAALAHAAASLGAHPVIRRLAEEEPAVLATLLAPAPTAHGWVTARAAVEQVLAAAEVDPSAADLVLRWLLSHAAVPDAQAAKRGAAQLAMLLTREPPNPPPVKGVPGQAELPLFAAR